MLFCSLSLSLTLTEIVVHNSSGSVFKFRTADLSLPNSFYHPQGRTLSGLVVCPPTTHIQVQNCLSYNREIENLRFLWDIIWSWIYCARDWYHVLLPLLGGFCFWKEEVVATFFLPSSLPLFLHYLLDLHWLWGRKKDQIFLPET